MIDGCKVNQFRHNCLFILSMLKNQMENTCETCVEGLHPVFIIHSPSLYVIVTQGFPQLSGRVRGSCVQLFCETVPWEEPCSSSCRVVVWLRADGRSKRKALTRIHVFFFFVRFFSIVSFNTCGAVLLTIPTSEIGENLKPLRGVRKKCLWERKKKEREKERWGSV